MSTNSNQSKAKNFDNILSYGDSIAETVEFYDKLVDDLHDLKKLREKIRKLEEDLDNARDKRRSIRCRYHENDFKKHNMDSVNKLLIDIQKEVFNRKGLTVKKFNALLNTYTDIDNWINYHDE